ncbi:MAG: SulP family inorganic anion transporter, partial [Desulfobulbus sp.]|nr:SulP family inorganic anion transporter [Desulfobulbus sp.]
MVNRLVNRLIPFIAWFPLSPLILRADLLAGVIGALVQVPKAMAYAQLAGLPLQYGLYAALVPAIIGALWGSSRHLATGPVAVVSLMTAAAVTPLAVPGSEEYIGLVLLLTLMVGCIQFVLGALTLGSAVNFVSHPVVLGFMNAAAIIIGLSQLDMLFGIAKGRSDFFLKDVWDMLGYLPFTHLPTLAMSVFGLALILVVRRIRVLNRPGILIVVVVTTMVSWLVGFEHNVDARIDEIASPRAREMVENYSRKAQRIATKNASLTDLSSRLRQAEKEENFRTVADLRYRLELLGLDIEAAEIENRNRLRAIRRLYFVRAAVAEEEPAPLYQLGEEPDELVADGRRLRVKGIGTEELQLMGGGEVVGSIPAGLPSFRLPAFSLEGILQLLSAALVIALVGFMEAISMAKALAGKVRQRIDPNQELIGQGLANIGGSFFQGYPASGSFTGSAINMQAGAQTGMAMVFNGVFIGVTLLFLTPYIYHLP